MKSILDPSFRYTNSFDTDIRKTFARVRREQRGQTKLLDGNATKVFPINELKRSVSAQVRQRSN